MRTEVEREGERVRRQIGVGNERARDVVAVEVHRRARERVAATGAHPDEMMPASAGQGARGRLRAAVVEARERGGRVVLAEGEVDRLRGVLGARRAPMQERRP